MRTASSDDEFNPYVDVSQPRLGRIELLGLDRDALRRRAAALVPADLEPALANGDTTRLAAIFDAWPANVHLRRMVYGGLAAAGKVAEVEALAAPRAVLAQPAADDVVAWLMAKSTRLQQAGAREVFEEAMRAVQRHPREARLYLVLGRAAARAFPEQPSQARQCFDRVVALASWGEVADRARAELQALDRR